MTIIIIDNYDSFTWNLAQAIGEIAAAEPRVLRNDELSVEAVERLEPDALIISPGPGTPDRAGISVPLVRRLSGRVPILGVCLGHQAIGCAFGARVMRAPRVMHGKVSRIHHAGTGIFEGIESPFVATRYHSLVVPREDLPAELEVVAWTEDAEDAVIQGMRHRSHETWGVQFHPESVATDIGPVLLRNLLVRAGCV